MRNIGKFGFLATLTDCDFEEDVEGTRAVDELLLHTGAIDM